MGIIYNSAGKCLNRRLFSQWTFNDGEIARIELKPSVRKVPFGNVDGIIGLTYQGRNFLKACADMRAREHAHVKERKENLRDMF